MEVFGIIGMSFGIMGMGLGLIGFMRLDKLEKQLKESGYLDKGYKSQPL
ncbi:MAG: hypothetical protein IH972_03285 [Candidatus Marinimicrobia bacterium]|nr:hypothetical protein [Candidatus Neomarinimicrobiota bacterium]